MRHFLPIKGPGGRALTAKEKVALVVLAVTLILCVLTLLAGDHAFGPHPAQNPVFSVVSALAGSVGVGIIALYAIVMLWSGLIFFKGEKVAEDKPLPGRAMAAVAIVIGVSGILGLSGLDAAGDLGSLVGRAIGENLGFVFGFAVLLGLLALGANLAGQGAWSALRGPTPALATAAPAPVSGGFSLPKQSTRVGAQEYLPDDGDPSADERTRAIAQAMEEIERSKGVTIVDMQPERSSIGEEVEALEESAEDTEEAQVRSGLADVATALAQLQARLDEDAARQAELAEEEAEADDFEPKEEDLEEDSEEEEDELEAEFEDDEEEDDDEVDDEDEEDFEEEFEETSDEDEDDLEEEEDDEDFEDEELDDEEEDEEDDDDEDRFGEEEPDEDEDFEDEEAELAEEEFEGEDDDLEEEEEWDDEEEVREEDEDDDEPVVGSGSPPRIAQPYLFPVSRREIDDDPEEAEVEESMASASREPDGAEDEEEDRAAAGTRFDWRGRPID